MDKDLAYTLGDRVFTPQGTSWNGERVGKIAADTGVCLIEIGGKV